VVLIVDTMSMSDLLASVADDRHSLTLSRPAVAGRRRHLCGGGWYPQNNGDFVSPKSWHVCAPDDSGGGGVEGCAQRPASKRRWFVICEHGQLLPGCQVHAAPSLFIATEVGRSSFALFSSALPPDQRLRQAVRLFNDNTDCMGMMPFRK
jgi:hypothetical protein